MTKKGFTLVELIAVIVILALIALVVFPAINSIIRNSKEKAYEAQIATIVKAAKEYYYDNTDKLPDEVEGATDSVSVSTLLSNGYISEDDIKDPRKTSTVLSGVVKVTFTSNQYVYEYTENNSEETIGGYLYENASSQANLKANKGVYKGSNPDNYLQYNGRLWRIMKINSDNSLKIVANEATTKLAWNDSGNAKFSNASINTYLNNTFYNALTNKENVQSVSWCTGNLDNACGETYTANIGLISTDDYALASNALGCNKNEAVCQNGNYLASYSVNNGAEYTMNHNDLGDKIYTINNGLLDGTSHAMNEALNIRPVLTLKAGAKITAGDGKATNPYIVS